MCVPYSVHPAVRNGFRWIVYGIVCFELCVRRVVVQLLYVLSEHHRLAARNSSEDSYRLLSILIAFHRFLGTIERSFFIENFLVKHFQKRIVCLFNRKSRHALRESEKELTLAGQTFLKFEFQMFILN